MKYTTNKFYRAGSLLLALVGSPFALIAQDESVEKPRQLPAAILRKYDADKDGMLNEEEKSAWKADVQRGRRDAQARRLEKYDANRDGKLDKVGSSDILFFFVCVFSDLFVVCGARSSYYI